MFIYLPFLFFFSFILVLAVVFPKFRIYWQKVKVVFGSSIFLSALVIITTLFDFLSNNPEATSGMFILGLPLTIFIEASGKISAEYGKNIWFLLCAMLFTVNTSCVFFASSFLLRLIVHYKKQN